MTETYRVRSGDNLWNIAREKLGHGNQWPRLWRYNNRRDVIARTGHAIPNPDLIHPGQRLLLPILPGTPAGTGAGRPPRSSSTAVPRPSTPPGSRPGQAPGMTGGEAQPLRRAPATGDTEPADGLAVRLPHVQSPISFKYKLDDLKFPPMETPDFTIEIKMTGDVVLMSRRAVPALYVTSRHELELQVTSQANFAFNSLLADTRVIYDEKENKLTYRSMLVSQSKTPGVPATAIGLETNSNGVLKLRFEIRLPRLEGSIPDFLYVGESVVVMVEFTPHPHPPVGPVAQPLRAPQAVRQPARGIDWGRLAGIGLIATGAALIVGTLVEDFFTAGAGAADDPVSFAAAGGLFARGAAMARGAALVLPRAAVPATVTLSLTVTARASRH